ncbi:hypothetical protein DIE66_01970 [Mycoplasmopsis arginini]|nr:hypothetical protein DIE66_01970 [Mycoplasmopsis arginini]
MIIYKESNNPNKAISKIERRYVFVLIVLIMFRNQFIKNVLITPFFAVNTITIIANKTDYRIQTKKQAKTCF